MTECYTFWRIFERARNIGTKTNPYYVTIWKGRDNDNIVRWLVNNKPDTTTENGAVFSVDGSPNHNDQSKLSTAIREFKKELLDNDIDLP